MASTKPPLLRRLSRTAMATVLAVTVLTATALTVAFRGVSGSRRPAAKVTGATGNLAPENSKKGRAILTARNIGPGDTSTGTVSIRNAAPVPVSMTLAIAKLKQRFGAGGGRLADRLLLEVADLTNRRRVVAVHRGPIGTMPVRRLGVWRAREARTYRFAVTFVPGGAEDNAYMGASLSLSYRWTARAAPKVSRPLVRPSGEDPLARRRIAVIVRCPRACTITASGHLRGRSGRRTRHLASLGASRRRLRANRPTPVHLRLERRALASIRRALRRGQRVEAVVEVAARRGANGRSVLRVPVLKRPR